MRTIILALPVAVLAQAAALEPEVEQAFAKYMAVPKALLPVLKQAQDQHGADKAAPALRQAMSVVYDAREAMSRVKSLSPRDTAEAKARYEKPMREEWGKLYQEIFRLQECKCYGSVEFFKLFQYMCLMLEK